MNMIKIIYDNFVCVVACRSVAHLYFIHIFISIYWGGHFDQIFILGVKPPPPICILITALGKSQELHFNLANYNLAI